MKNIVMAGLCKSYGDNQVVKNIDLNIEEGERLILLGPSGCGKSTILRMIAGLEEITDGTMSMGGQVVNGVESGKRNVSMVFQNYALYPHMTVEQNIVYGLKVKKLPSEQIEERKKEAIRMLALEGLEKRKPKDISGGQRQRVALARAIVKRSDFLLLDEPLSNLDAQLRQHSRKELVKIHEKYQQTFVYVTHDQVEAMTVGTKIALLNDGILQMVDTPKKVYNHPANVFTAKFIGSPCCNIVKVKHYKNRLFFGTQAVVMPKPWIEKARKIQTDGDFIFGIRPEHIKLEFVKGNNSLEGTVKYVEDYGNQAGVSFEVEGEEFTAMVQERIPEPGETVYFRPDFNHIHLFDNVTEQSIGYPGDLVEEEEWDAAICEYKSV